MGTYTEKLMTSIGSKIAMPPRLSALVRLGAVDEYACLAVTNDINGFDLYAATGDLKKLEVQQRLGHTEEGWAFKQWVSKWPRLKIYLVLNEYDGQLTLREDSSFTNVKWPAKTSWCEIKVVDPRIGSGTWL